MTISKSRSSTRKLGLISTTGSKTVRFRIPNYSRRFTVHEDIICRSSAYFRSKLQKNRKPFAPPRSLSNAPDRAADDVNGEGECFVCHDSLDSTTHDITFCSKCGQNVHEDCIEQWKQNFAHRDGDQVRPAKPTCPMCRADWLDQPFVKSVNLSEQLDADAVQMYLQWLYTDTLHILQFVKKDIEAASLATLKCVNIAIVLEDDIFKDVCLRKWFDEKNWAKGWTDSVDWAFTQGKASKRIRMLMADVFLAFVEPGWFVKESSKWPTEFVNVLADRLMEGSVHGGGEYGVDRLRRKWLEKEEPVYQFDRTDDIRLHQPRDPGTSVRQKPKKSLWALDIP